MDRTPPVGTGSGTGGPGSVAEAAALRASLAEAEARLAEQQASLIRLRATAEAAHTEFQRMEGSLSWRVTRPLRVLWNFVVGFGPFLQEMRGFPRRVRYTVATRGVPALLGDIRSELAKRLRRGTLAPPPAGPPSAMAAAATPLAVRGDGPPSERLVFPLAGDPHVSVVIPAFNEFARTYACLASILERTDGVSYEVVVVDDGSTDETRDIEHLVAGIRVVRSEESVGFIGACNRGAEVARGEYLVFLNNDTYVSTGWLGHLLEPFQRQSGGKDVGLVGAKLVYPDGRLQEAGGIVFADGSGWNYGRGDDPSKPKYEFQREVSYCSGACIAIPRTLFSELGGFDASYAPMYYEDVDLALRVRASGRAVLYQPSCVIIHFEGGTAGTDTSSGKKRFQTINRSKLVERWAERLRDLPQPGTDPDRACYTSDGPHVLVIDSYTPRPDRDAGSVRMRFLCRILSELGCRVTFIPENRANDGAYTRALQGDGVEVLYHPYLPSIEDHLRERGARYDMVILSRLEVASRFIGVVQTSCPKARTVFDTVDLQFLREQRRADVTGTKNGRAERLKEAELSVARACDLTLVVSPAEKDILATEAPDVDVDIVSLILAPDRTETPFVERSGVVFIGSFQHPPNGDAVEYYLREIHPAVQERVPGTPFTVIGQQPPDSLRRLADETVFFTGHVTDIRPLFAAARLSVAPLRFGAGLKGKIQTSLSFGVPAVTTTVGAEGMSLVHGEHILIADTPQEFADAVVRLHEDSALWEKLAANGPRGVSDQCSVDNARTAIARVVGADGNGVAGERMAPSDV